MLSLEKEGIFDGVNWFDDQKENNKLFFEAVGKHGRDWESVARQLGGKRTSKQINDYYYNLRRKVKLGDPNFQDDDLKEFFERERTRKRKLTRERTIKWTEEEQVCFIQALCTHGKDWDAIAAELGTRTVLQVKKRYENLK